MRHSSYARRRRADRIWSDAPPNTLNDPDLYDGIAWRRAAAYLFDLAVLALLGLAVWFGLGLVAVMTFGLLFPLQVAALAVLPVAYHTFFVGGAGATPGMRFFDVEIRSWTGARPDYFLAFLQSVLFYATVSLTAWLVIVVALFNDRQRTLHDFMAGTLGVRHSRVSAEGLLKA